MRIKILPAVAATLACICFTPLLLADEATQRTAAAEELLKAMHIDEMMSTMMAKQKEAIIKMTSSFMPKDVSAEKVQQGQAMQSKTMDIVYKQLTWESLKPDFVQAYSQVYTEQELRDLTTFYKTPIGQKLVEKMPELQEKTMQIVQKRMGTIMPEVQKVIKESIEQEKAAEKPSASPSPDAK